MLPLPHALPAMPLPISLLPSVPGPRALCCACNRTPQSPSARLARPAAFACVVCVCVCVCVCVGWCDAPVPVDVSLVFGSAVVCCSVASAFCWFGRCFAFVLIYHTYARPHTPLACPRHSQLTRRAPHTHRTHHTLTTPSITLPHLALYTHATSTPQHIHSSHRIIPTNSLPQTRSCSRKSEMAYSLVFCALWMHVVL